jgi:hypothetical protein
METRIEAAEIEDVFRVSRGLIRKEETVWVMMDNKLKIRDVDILLQDAEYAYITSGLNDHEKVVVTNLTTVAEGVSLRVENSSSESANDSVSNIEGQKQVEQSMGGTQ